MRDHVAYGSCVRRDTDCIRAIPYIRAWADKYRNSSLVVIGVHTPEFDIEKEMPNVETLSRAW